ncbi:hypothetical protein C8R45DRAFT_944345 [Mycena sanguinolenta]|nr:hypothetical protein C8R45DRAFT_944345 [Mycena sanguinolenta]
MPAVHGRRLLAKALERMSSDAEDDTPTRVPAQPARKSKALVPKSRQSIKVESTPKLPALVKKPAIKAESSGTFQYTPPTHADVKGLPAFIGTTWPAFLAVLHHALNLSHDPMQFGTRVNAVAEVQRVQDRLDLSALPVGAMVMGAIAVERAYKLHSTGRRAENTIPDFSATKYATAATGYLKSILSMTEGRWTSILEACGATASVAEAASDSLDVLDGERENMYIPSSP